MKSLPKILHLIDSFDYVKNNCFQHQLASSLLQFPNVVSVQSMTIAQLLGSDVLFDGVVCCLKLRSLYRNANVLGARLCNTPVVVYDQDPWAAYMDGTECKHVHEYIKSLVNVRSFAVTTKVWADELADRGLPSMFVKMWVLPQYCNPRPEFVNRTVDAGFVGRMHPYRQQFFDRLKLAGVDVNVLQDVSLPYEGYLNALSFMKVCVRGDDFAFRANDKEMNLRDCLWIKDIEAAARGCYVIRPAGKDAETYLGGIETVLMYDSIERVPVLLEQIRDMDAKDRQDAIDRTVTYIAATDKWINTARTLLQCAAGVA